MPIAIPADAHAQAAQGAWRAVAGATRGPWSQPLLPVPSALPALLFADARAVQLAAALAICANALGAAAAYRAHKQGRRML